MVAQGGLEAVSAMSLRAGWSSGNGERDGLEGPHAFIGIDEVGNWWSFWFYWELEVSQG